MSGRRAVCNFWSNTIQPASLIALSAATPSESNPERITAKGPFLSIGREGLQEDGNVLGPARGFDQGSKPEGISIHGYLLPSWDYVDMVGFRDFTIGYQYHRHVGHAWKDFDEERFPVSRLVMNNNVGHPGVPREEGQNRTIRLEAAR